MYEDLGFAETNDTGFLLKALNGMYAKTPLSKTPLRIAVTLSDFIEEGQHQLSFFEIPQRQGAAYKAVDQINEKFGRDTIYAGSLHERKSSAPTRIAFARVPGLEEVEDSAD